MNERTDTAGALSLRWPGRLDLTPLWAFLAAALTYLVAVRVGLMFVLPGANVSLVWPAAGAALAGAWLFGLPGLLAASLAAGAGQLFLGHGAGAGVAVALGVGIAAGAGATLLRRCGFDPAMRRLSDVLLFVGIGAVGASTLSSLTGAGVMYALGLTEWGGFGGLWWICWVADGIGTLLLAPVLFTWSVPRPAADRDPAVVETSILMLAVAGAGWLVYSDVLPSGIAMARPLSYVVFPVMILAAVRTGVRDTALMLLVHATIAVAFTADGHGPFASGTLRESLLALHAHIAMLGGSVLMLTAVMGERRAANRALADSEAKYRLLVENQTDLIVKTDAAGRILFASPTVAGLFGGRDDGLTGRPFRELVRDADLNDPASPWHALLAPPWSCYLERPATTAHGERWIGWAAKTIRDAQGRPDGVVAVGRDVTDRRHAEADSREYFRELAHVGRLSAMGEMAAGLAHELNQPLCAITTYAQACQRLLGNDARPELAQAIQRVADNGARAGGIIRQMRSFVRKDTRDATVIDLNTAVRGVVGLTEPEARAGGVTVTVNAARALPPVTAVEIQIHQVLVNLVRNAIEALAAVPEGARFLTLETAREGDEVVVRVIDTGPGLSAEVIDTVFNPFVTGKSEGMGLGLSISRSIIENHGGRLTGTNGPDGGARFEFRLPAAADTDQGETS